MKAACNAEEGRRLIHEQIAHRGPAQHDQRELPVRALVGFPEVVEEPDTFAIAQQLLDFVEHDRHTPLRVPLGCRHQRLHRISSREVYVERSPDLRRNLPGGPRRGHSQASGARRTLIWPASELFPIPRPPITARTALRPSFTALQSSARSASRPTKSASAT